MTRRWAFFMVMAAAAALVVSTPMRAEQGAASAGPTAKDPLRFSAFGVSMEAGASGRIEVAIERWTTDTERTLLSSALVEGGQKRLLSALQDVKVRTGFIRAGSSIGYDLRYSRDNMLPDGTRQIVIATDKPVSFLAVVSGARTLEYPFTILELRFPKGNAKGEGRMLVQTAIAVKNGQLQLENYGQEPVRLTQITQEK